MINTGDLSNPSSTNMGTIVIIANIERWKVVFENKAMEKCLLLNSFFPLFVLYYKDKQKEGSLLQEMCF